MTRTRLARLLAGRNQPSVREREALFERIWESVQPTPLRRRPTLTPTLAACLSAAALIIGVLWMKTGERDAFRARGAHAARAGLTLRCLGAEPTDQSSRSARSLERSRAADGAAFSTACELSEQLAFEVDAPVDARYLAIFALARDGSVIWYFPSSREALALPRQPPFVLNEAVRLAPRHAPGAYTVFALFSAQPLSRAQLRSANLPARLARARTLQALPELRAWGQTRTLLVAEDPK